MSKTIDGITVSNRAANAIDRFFNDSHSRYVNDKLEFYYIKREKPTVWDDLAQFAYYEIRKWKGVGDKTATEIWNAIVENKIQQILKKGEG